MLAGLCRLDRVLGVEPVRGHDVDDVDVRVARDFVHRGLAPDVRLGKPVVSTPLDALFVRTGHDPREAASFVFLSAGPSPPE